MPRLRRWCYRSRKGGPTHCLSCNFSVDIKPLLACSHPEHLAYFLRRRPKRAEEARIYRIKARNKVLLYYGAKCACCGYSNLSKRVRGRSFLEIDHINGGGRKHKRTINRGSLEVWLQSQNYPVGYRILCASCNIAMEPREPICEYHKEIS